MQHTGSVAGIPAVRQSSTDSMFIPADITGQAVAQLRKQLQGALEIVDRLE